MIAVVERDGEQYVQVSTEMTAEDWQHMQIAFLDVTSDLMCGTLTVDGKNGVANLMRLLKEMMLNEKQIVKGLQVAA